MQQPIHHQEQVQLVILYRVLLVNKVALNKEDQYMKNQVQDKNLKIQSSFPIYTFQK